ncbi:MAG: hypothetical protein ACLP01_16940 [Solirubrobacteraceae bacterium]
MIEQQQVHLDNADVRGLWDRHLSDPRRERAFLSAVGFNAAFATCRLVTHSIRAGVGPFGNLSAGGRHLHHSTLGIFGLVGIGYVWTYQVALGTHPRSRWGSRITATTYGIACALTLDEFALWFDLADDYWDAQGRKSIDAVALFSSLLTAGVAGRGALHELSLVARRVARGGAVTPSGDGASKLGARP